MSFQVLSCGGRACTEVSKAEVHACGPFVQTTRHGLTRGGRSIALTRDIGLG